MTFDEWQKLKPGDIISIGNNVYTIDTILDNKDRMKQEVSPDNYHIANQYYPTIHKTRLWNYIMFSIVKIAPMPEKPLGSLNRFSSLDD